MAKAKFDITTLELPTVATKPLYAGVGVTDLAVEAVRDYVSDVSKKIADVQKSVTDFEPKALRQQVVSAVGARRSAVEARVADLQSDALALPTRVQTRVQASVNDNVATVSDAYADLAKRGEDLVGRIRKQESTQATAAAARTATAKAKATRTQGTKAAKTTATTTSTAAKKTATTARKSASATVSKATTTAKKTSTSPRSSAKGTVTAAKKTATNATQAVSDAAEKVGD